MKVYNFSKQKKEIGCGCGCDVAGDDDGSWSEVGGSDDVGGEGAVQDGSGVGEAKWLILTDRLLLPFEDRIV